MRDGEERLVDREMTTDATSVAAPSADVTAVDEPGLFARWFHLIFSPEKTFASIGRRPVVLGALALIVLFSCGANFFFFRSDLVEDLLYEQFMDNPRTASLTEAQIDQALWFSKNLSPVVPIVTTPIMVLLVAGILYVVTVVLFSGPTSFRHLLSLVTHVLLIMPLQVLFTFGLIASAETFEIGANLLLFFPDVEKGSFLHGFLRWMDFFALWELLLLGLGLAALCRWRAGRVLIVLLLLYFALAGGMAGAGTWFARMGAH